MPTQVVNSELVDLLRPFFWAKSDTVSCCPWKLCSPDGTIDPVAYVDNSGDFYVANGGVTSNWVETQTLSSPFHKLLDIEGCFEISYDCVYSGAHAHVGFSILDSIFFESDTDVDNLGPHTICNIGVNYSSGILLVNAVAGSASANAQFMGVVYFSNVGAGGLLTAIEPKVGAANGTITQAGTLIQFQANNADLTRVSVIRINSAYL